MWRPPLAENQRLSLREVMYQVLAEELVERYVQKRIVTPKYEVKPSKAVTDKFSENGKIPVEFLMKSRKKYETSSFAMLPYTRRLVTRLMQLDKEGWLGYYGKIDLWFRNLIEKHPIKGKTIAIYGSRFPWYEAICLNRGAIPFTIEFERPNCEDSRIKVMTHQEVEETKMKFDFALSISSIEHAGFPFYGGPVDPIADIESMKFIRNHLKRDGKFFFSVPLGLDKVRWPNHRIYGERRFDKLIKGWKIIDSQEFDRKKHLKLDGFGFHSLLLLKKTLF